MSQVPPFNVLDETWDGGMILPAHLGTQQDKMAVLLLEDVIFTHETSVEILQYTRYCFQKDGSQPKRKSSKHPVKVSISTSQFQRFTIH